MRAVCAEEDVVRLEVPMEDVPGMKVLDGTHDLLEDMLGLHLRHRACFLQKLSQLATLRQLHDNHLPLCALDWVGVDELYDVRVLANVTVDLNLSVQHLCICGEDLLDG